MKYTEVIIETTESGIDECCDKLSALGLCEYVIENEADFRSFLENNRQYWDYVDKELEDRYAGVSRIKLYLDEGSESMLEEIKNAGLEFETNVVDDADWENNWKQYYKPLEIGDRLIVVPEWEETELNGRVPLRLDPGLMFGTGSHATTRMCLEALQNFERSTWAAEAAYSASVRSFWAQAPASAATSIRRHPMWSWITPH